MFFNFSFISILQTKNEIGIIIKDSFVVISITPEFIFSEYSNPIKYKIYKDEKSKIVGFLLNLKSPLKRDVIKKRIIIGAISFRSNGITKASISNT